MNPGEKTKVIAALSEFVETKTHGDDGLVCTVKSVDQPTNTCYCEPVGDYADIQNVRYIASGDIGIKIIPKVNSIVVVSFLSDSSAFISQYGEIEEINWTLSPTITMQATSTGFVFNGGALDGLVKLAAAVSKYNALENKVNAILAAITTTWIPVANDGGAALKALFGSLATTTLAPVAITINSDIENPDIKQ